MTDVALDSEDLKALLGVFSVEAEENIASMEDALLALESAPDDGALIATIFRAAHTLKGNCASVGLDSLVGLAHAAEDLLDELRSQHLTATAEIITLLLEATDTLKTLLPQAVASPAQQPAPDPRLVDALRAAARGEVSEPRTKSSAVPANANAAPEPVSPVKPAPASNSLRVDTRKLDLLLNAVSELNITRGRVRTLSGSAEGELSDMLDQLDRLTDTIEDLVLQTRMVPIGPVLRQQVRTARDLATRTGKQVSVEIAGEAVELDTSVIERLRDPLTHMIRNSVDHGVEAPEVREACGKNAAATISMRASHSGGMIVVEVSDDGAGIDPVRIRERARLMQLDTEVLSERDLLRLVLLPGFSTARSVTEVSGRGIGLDVVEKNVAAVGGSIAIDSVLGQGTTFTIRLPLTVAVLHGLSTRVGDELYIVPIPTVSECIDMPEAQEGRPRNETGVFTLRGEALPFLRLRDHFHSTAEPAMREKVVVVEYDRKRAGLVVDDFIGETRAVVKPMSRLFRRASWISGSALLGSGDIGLVLEVATILDDVARRQARQNTGKDMT